MSHLLQRFLRRTDAQDLIEYALLSAFVSLVALVAFAATGGNLGLIYTRVSAAVVSGSSQGGPAPDPGTGTGNNGNGNNDNGNNGRGRGRGGGAD